MDSKIPQTKAKSFLKKGKVLVLVFVIGVIIIALFLVVLPILFCPKMDLYLDQDQKYTSCIQDSDCIPEISGCLNKQGVEKFKFFNFLCKPWSNCLTPSVCLCQDGQCIGAYGLFD